MKDREGTIIKIGQYAKIIYCKHDFKVAEINTLISEVILEYLDTGGWVSEHPNKIIVEE